ncbi:MAG: DUF72 domain-containing protein [Acidobacteriota bacterium]
MITTDNRSPIHLGTSGFSYTEWRPGFYPEDLSPKKFLSFYSEHFDTTEINNTFYRLPTAKLTEGWYGEVPENFLFTLKLSQKITHIRRLREVDEEMNFFLTSAASLKEKLGAILVQLPPNMKKDTERLADFLAKYATRGRLAFEFRHDSWFSDDVYELLKKHQSALGVIEKEEGEGAAVPREVTGPFAYIRLRKGEYSKPELQEWAKWIRSRTTEVFCYVKHDVKAPLLARQLFEAIQEV